MPLSKYRPLTYTSLDWQIMTEAHRLASRELGRHPKNHEHSDRLARTILNFYDRGIKDAGVLSTLSVNREQALVSQEAKNTRTNERLARTGNTGREAENQEQQSAE